MSDASTTLGYHWIVDLHGCPPALLDDHDLIRHRLKETTERFDLTLLKIVSNRFEPQGVTAVGLLAESHMSIHTWPEHGYAAVDIFTCGSESRLKSACQFLVEALQAQSCNVLRLQRGILTDDGASRMASEPVSLNDD